MYAVLNYKDWKTLSGEVVKIWDGKDTMLIESQPSGTRLEPVAQVGEISVVNLLPPIANHNPTKYISGNTALKTAHGDANTIKAIENIVGRYFICNYSDPHIDKDDEDAVFIYWGSQPFGATRTDLQDTTVPVGKDNIRMRPADVLSPLSVTITHNDELYVLAQGTREKIFVQQLSPKELINVLLAYKDAKETRLQPSVEYIKKTFEDILNKSKKDVEASIQTIREEVIGLQTQIIKSVRKQNKLQIALDQFGETIKVTNDDIVKKMEEIARIESVRKCLFIGNKLLVETAPIKCETKNATHLIGRLQIHINLTNFSITFDNLDLVYDRKPAPHVFGDGHPCLGNISADIPKLLGSYELSAAVALLIGFLQQANTADPEGRKVAYWPQLTSKNKINFTSSSITIKNKYLSENKKDANYADYEAYCLDHPGSLG